MGDVLEVEDVRYLEVGGGEGRIVICMPIWKWIHTLILYQTLLR